MLKIKLYKTASRNNKAVKELTDELELTGFLRESCDVENPVITISKNKNLMSYNYAEIEEFGRKYFFTKAPEIEENGIYMRIFLHVDVLSTYYSQLKTIRQVIGRQQNDFNKDIPDPLLTAINQKNMKLKNFCSQQESPFVVFSADSDFRPYVLITAGPGPAF